MQCRRVIHQRFTADFYSIVFLTHTQLKVSLWVMAERRLAAIMFSDIVGYSKRMGEHESTALRMAGRHNGLMTEATNAYGGHIVKSLGDGLLIEFPSAVNAVKCAMAVQKNLAAHNKKLPESEQIWLRIGIHLGDILTTGTDIYGDGVNIASRIEPLAEPGGICISQDVYNQIKGKIEVETISIGPKDLHNIDRQVEIYRVIATAINLPSKPSSKPVEARDGKKKRIPWWVWVGASVLLIAVLLIMLPRGKGENKQADVEAQKAFESAIGKAQSLLDQKKPEEAVSVLEGFPPNLLNTQRLVKIDNLLLQSKSRIFLDLIAERNVDVLWHDLKKLMHPKVVDEIERKGGVKNLLGAFLILQFLKKDILDSKIGDATVMAGGNKGIVTYKLLLKRPEKPQGTWKEQFLKWDRVEGRWYLAEPEK